MLLAVSSQGENHLCAEDHAVYAQPTFHLRPILRMQMVPRPWAVFSTEGLISALLKRGCSKTDRRLSRSNSSGEKFAFLSSTENFGGREVKKKRSSPTSAKCNHKGLFSWSFQVVKPYHGQND